jgi:RNA-binding protein
MSDESTPRSQLRGFQRRYLRAQAHHLRASVDVGKEGVTDAVIAVIRKALLEHELIKVRLRRPENRKAMASELAERNTAELCGLIGGIAILYRRHPDSPRIEIPTAPGAAPRE